MLPFYLTLQGEPVAAITHFILGGLKPACLLSLCLSLTDCEPLSGALLQNPISRSHSSSCVPLGPKFSFFFSPPESLFDGWLIHQLIVQGCDPRNNEEACEVKVDPHEEPGPWS